MDKNKIKKRWDNMSGDHFVCPVKSKLEEWCIGFIEVSTNVITT